MRIVITGASGFIAGALVERLAVEYELTLLSRHPQNTDKLFKASVKVVQWDGKNCKDWIDEINGAYAVINLAGENIAGIWSNAKKKRILHSRLDSANAVKEAILQVSTKPKILIQASATGYYGSQGMLELDETSKQGAGFLAEVCHQTENAVSGLQITGIRSVIMRTGVVLGAEKGALPRLIFPFKFYLGGYPGNGKQYISWITIADLVEAIKFIIERQNLQGVYNLTSPAPVTMKELCMEIGKNLKRPCWLAVPSFILRLAFGEMAEQVLLASQKVIPKRLLDSGFEFQHPDIAGALKSVILNLQSEKRSV